MRLGPGMCGTVNTPCGSCRRLKETELGGVRASWPPWASCLLPALARDFSTSDRQGQSQRSQRPPPLSLPSATQSNGLGEDMGPGLPVFVNQVLLEHSHCH